MAFVVVGGGLTGLAAAYELGRAGVPTLLLEASERLGGKVRTDRVDGFLVESGPDSFVSYRPAGLQLIAELGLADQVIAPQAPRTVYIWARDRLVPMPEGLDLVLPTKFLPFLRTPLFTLPQKARMGLDLVLPRSRWSGDMAIGAFLRRRLGPALVDRLASPLIGGIYGTEIDELSLDAVLPQLAEAERRHRSLLLASIASRRARSKGARAKASGGGASGGGASGGGGPSPAPFVTLAGGTGALVEALVEAIARLPSVEVRTGAPVEAVELAASGSVSHPTRGSVRLGRGEVVPFDGLVLATPAPVSASLLEPSVPAVAPPLRSILYGSTAVVTLAYDEREFEATEAGHGFLVAGDAGLSISAGTISSRKWAGRAPAGGVLVRAFLGDGAGALLAAPDDALVAAVQADLSRAIGLRGEPLFSRIARWPGAMPHYIVGHLERVAAAEAALADRPSVALAGSAYRGVGLPDCVGQGRAAARRVLEAVGGEVARSAAAR
ncbi:MAG TPA: protoporphyrinogen oxidase [Candidatus Limnocylindrales bacterium]